MNNRRNAKLIGAVRLVPKVDGIGVAVFTAENAMLVPEMDGDFKVIGFLDFYNEQGFQISYDLPVHYRERTVSVGDPSPVPFWHKGVCSVIEGDAEKAAIEQLFGTEARTNPVLRDLGRMLDDARSGRIKARIAEWEAADLASGFDDVFLEPPSRTRYWVARYRVALQNARKLANPPHPIDVRLRNAANTWLRKFGSKSDPAMLGSMLGSSAQGIFSNTQIRNILFAYIVQKLATETVSDLEIIRRDGTASSVFPKGIFNYFIKNGWPHVPFKYQQIDLLELMKEAVNQGAERSNFENAVRLSKLLFGQADAPRDVDDHVMLLVPGVANALKTAAKRGEDEYHQFPRTTDMAALAQEVMKHHRRLEQLSRIMHGADRAAGRMLDGRFGIKAAKLDNWRMWAGVPEER